MKHAILQLRTIKILFLSCLFFLTILITISCGNKKQVENTSANVYTTIGSIDRLSPKLDEIVAREAQLEILAEGHEWTEGPVWVAALNGVLYSDIPRNAIYLWTENQPASIWLQPAGYTANIPRGGESGSNGLVLDNEGRLVLAQHGDRCIARLTSDWTKPEAKFKKLADTYKGKRFNSPNDLVISSRGDIYFTDPPYGMEKGENDPAKEMEFQGVYRISSDGTVTLLVDDISRPNGICLSPDGSILYVANSDSDHPEIWAFDVLADGSLENRRLFYSSWGDGMKVDQQGNLYVAGPGNGVMILSAQGEHLGSLLTTQRTSNCAFGDDGSTLFITSDMYLLRIPLKIKGAGF